MTGGLPEGDRAWPVKRAVSLAVPESWAEEGTAGRVLAVLRPPDDPELPGLWGLPATSLEEGEHWEEALVRAGLEKLGVNVEPVRMLAEGTQDRPGAAGPSEGVGYTLHMRVFQARILRGKPLVPQSEGSGTQYREWRWAEPGALRPAADRGSLCTRLYLDSLESGPGGTGS